VKVWRLKDWKLMARFEDVKHPIFFINPNGPKLNNEMLLTTSEQGVVIWDWRHKKKIATLPDAKGEYCWLSDNREVLLTEQKDSRLAVWNIAPLLTPLYTTFGEVKQSALLQNYPNPFNPETWIPFRLAEDADISIKIYDVVGQLVRRFELDGLSAGMYIDKDKAIYWDGRNASGETVSSGVYFYTIKANGFSRTKKMVIVR